MSFYNLSSQEFPFIDSELIDKIIYDLEVSCNCFESYIELPSEHEILELLENQLRKNPHTEELVIETKHGFKYTIDLLYLLQRFEQI